MNFEQSQTLVWFLQSVISSLETAQTYCQMVGAKHNFSPIIRATGK
jgi:hypothetical protein